MKLYEQTDESFNIYQSQLLEAKNGLDLTEFCNQKKQAFLEKGIGHVYIYGSLLSDATPIDLKLGNTDYGDIVEDIETMIEAGAKSILLHINSGGGTVQGNIEVAEYIQNLPIPVVAYVEAVACSAAYKIACSSTYVVSSKSAIVGNIGSILVKVDTSLVTKAMGVSYQAFVNDGAIYKSTGHLDSLTEEQKTFLQDQVNEAGSSFQNHVLSNRPSIDPVVWTAGWWSGNKAIDLGLIDMIGNEDDAERVCESLMNISFEPIILQESE